MHELSIATDLIETVSEYVSEDKLLQKVYVTIGPLSGISPDALQFCFEEVAQQFGHSHAVLVIKEVPAEFKCDGCGIKYSTESMYDFCPDCGSMERTNLSGSQFTVDAIDVEDKAYV